VSAAKAELAQSRPAASGTIRRIMSISIHFDDVSVSEGTRA
jgi:hypothetical protein